MGIEIKLVVTLYIPAYKKKVNQSQTLHLFYIKVKTLIMLINNAIKSLRTVSVGVLTGCEN